MTGRLVEGFFKCLENYCLIDTDETLSAIDMASSGHVDAIIIDAEASMNPAALIERLRCVTRAPIAVITSMPAREFHKEFELSAPPLVISVPYGIDEFRDALDRMLRDRPDVSPGQQVHGPAPGDDGG